MCSNTYDMPVNKFVDRGLTLSGLFHLCYNPDNVINIIIQMPEHLFAFGVTMAPALDARM